MPAARRIGVLVAMAAVLGMWSGLAPTVTTSAAVTTSTAAVAGASSPSPAHPFSDPVWSPLRSPTWTSCVLDNCPGPYHGHWAMDFISQHRGEPYDPLYAVGAGIFHIGGVLGKDTCSTTTASSGTWVWIDHGGGRSTRYTHLYRVLATEGQLVTPATQIGEVGHNGNRAPCEVNYLHMEYRALGNTGPMIAPRSMFACSRAGLISLPSQGLGRSYATWNDVRIDPRTLHGPVTPATTNACLPASWTSTPARPVVTARRGAGSVTASWGAIPASVGHTIVTIEQWHPSLSVYGRPEYRAVARTASSTRFTGLLNGRPYRVRASTHNSAGYSAWSPYVTVVPATVPSAPRAPRALSTLRNSIRYAWWLPADNGRPISHFVAARRCLVGGTWTGWTKTNVTGRVAGSWNLHYNWLGMPSGRTCQVMVQAVNSVGAGHWSRISQATTLR